VAVPLACWSLAAQDTTTAAAPAAALSQQPAVELPATHTVVRGETLWSIAQLYFSDPLLWPEVYRLNTALIEDPHWIYPGEVLSVSGPAGSAGPVVTAGPAGVAETPAETTVAVIAQGAPGADTVRAQPNPTDTVAAAHADTLPTDTTQAMQAVIEEPPPPAEESYQTIFDRPRSRTREVQDILRAYANQPYRPLRRGEFYGAGFLTEGEHLPWGRVLGTTDKPAIPRLTERSTAIQGQHIVIEPPPRASYHVGDSVLIVRVDRSQGDWGDVVIPLGVARVVEVARKQLLADVILQFGRIHDGHRTLPLEPFKDPGEVRPTPVDQGLHGHVIDQRDLHTIAITQQVIFIDRGRADGVVPGDVFQIYTGEPGSPSEELRAVIEIVHTRERSSSGLVLTLGNPQILPGLPARLVRKMPS
jgi:hypothetical protein